MGENVPEQPQYRLLAMLARRDPATGKLMLTDRGKKFRERNVDKPEGVTMTMLFLLLPIKTGKGTPWENMYDMQYGAVVRANSEKEAREMVSNKSGDEGPEVWLDPASVSCELLNHDGEFGVILQDFLAG